MKSTAGRGTSLPYVNSAQAAHPAFNRSVTTLRECGVTVLLGEGEQCGLAVLGPVRCGEWAT